MGFADRLKQLRKPKASPSPQQQQPPASTQPTTRQQQQQSGSPDRSPEEALTELRQKLSNLKNTVSKPAKSAAVAQAAQQLLSDCRNQSAILESQADTFADQEKFDLVQGVFETTEELQKINKAFDPWFNAATRTAVAHSVAVDAAPAGLPVTASQPVGDDRALSAFSRQIAELRMMIWDESKPVDQCDLAIAEAKSCSEALAGRMDVWLNKNESARINKLMKCNDDLEDVEEEWKVLRLQRGSAGTGAVAGTEGRQEEEAQRRDEEEALRAQKEEEERLEKARRDEEGRLQKAAEEEQERQAREEAERRSKEEAEEKDRQEEAKRKEKEEADRAAQEQAARAAAAAAEEAKRKEKEEADRAAQDEADRKKEEARRVAEERARQAEELEVARKEAEEAKKAAVEKQKAAADEARKAQEAKAKAKADDMRKRDLEMPKASAGAAAGGAAVGYGALKPRKGTEGGAKKAEVSDDERKEIEARNSRILWQMREEAAKKARQRRQEAAAAEEDRLMQTAVQFHKAHGGRAYEQSCLRLWSMYVRASQHARRRLYEAASDEEMAAAVDYATSISLDRPSDLQLIKSCRRKLEESDRQAVLQSELKAAVKARDLDALEEVLPALSRDSAGPEAYRVLSEEKLRDAVSRQAEPAELEQLVANGEENGAASVYITPAKALIDFYGARRKSDLMASVSYCAKLGLRDLPAEPLERLSEAGLLSRAFRKWQNSVYDEADRETVARFFFELWKRRLWMWKEVARLASDDAVSSAELAEAIEECRRLDIDGVDEEELAGAMERKKMLEEVYSARGVQALVEAAEKCREAGIPLDENFRAREVLGDALGVSLIPGALELPELERLIEVAKYAGVPTTYSEIVVQSRKWDATVVAFRKEKKEEGLRRVLDTWHAYARYSSRLETIEGMISISYEGRLEKESFTVWVEWAKREKDLKCRAAEVMQWCDSGRVKATWAAWKAYRDACKEKEGKAMDMAKASEGRLGKTVLQAWKSRSERVHRIALNSARDEESLTMALSECCYDEDLARRAGPDTIGAAKLRLAAIRLNAALGKRGSTPAELRDLWREAGRPEAEAETVGKKAWQLSLRRRALRCWSEEAQERKAVTHRVERCLDESQDSSSLFHLRATLEVARERDVKENDIIVAAERRLAEVDLSTELSRPSPSPVALGQLLRNPWLDRGDSAVAELVERANTIRASSVSDRVAKREARDTFSIWKDFATERVGLRRKLEKSTDIEELTQLVKTLSEPGHRHGDLVDSTGVKDRLRKLEWAEQEKQARRNRFQKFQEKWDDEESRWSLKSEASTTREAWPEDDRKADYFRISSSSIPTISDPPASFTTPDRSGRLNTPSRYASPLTTPSLTHPNSSPWGDRSQSPASSVEFPVKFSFKTPPAQQPPQTAHVQYGHSSEGPAGTGGEE
ncbi:hypothetical protein FOZ61_004302 [Perkinsus olseni]|uniref:Uncharacterized protein n=1 Tax=Perkinsus olseni TaxID=32597 RepID=A0A7J6LL88_PEROL|nr:hypothetical protein FOZ61_004302 [Perkinsus olseni]